MSSCFIRHQHGNVNVRKESMSCGLVLRIVNKIQSYNSFHQLLPEVESVAWLARERRPEDLVLLDVGVKEPLVSVLVVVVQSHGGGGVDDDLDVGALRALGVGGHDGVVVGEVELHLGLGGAGLARVPLADVPGGARALVAAVGVPALLVAVAPLLAFVLV